MSEVYQLPRIEGAGSVVELADGGRRYRKQLIKFGSFVDPNSPGRKIDLNKSFAERLVENFKSGIKRIPVVEGHPKTSAELLNATRGDLVGLSVEADGIYGDLDIKAAHTAAGIDDDLVQDVSISYDPEYVEKATGKNVGPMLRHVGLVNDPYLGAMAPFLALSDDVNVIMLSENKEPTMSTLKNVREFPVTVKIDGKDVELQPGAEAEVAEAEEAAVNQQIADAVKPEPTAEEKAAAEKEAADAAAKEAADKAAADAKAAEEAKKNENLSEADKLRVELSEAKTELAKRDAASEYDKLLHEGKLVPAQKDAYISLSLAAAGTTVNLSDGSSKPLSVMLTDLIAAGSKQVKFGEEGKPEGEASPFDQLSDGEKEATLKQGITAEQYNKVNAPKE